MNVCFAENTNPEQIFLIHSSKKCVVLGRFVHCMSLRHHNQMHLCANSFHSITFEERGRNYKCQTMQIIQKKGTLSGCGTMVVSLDQREKLDLNHPGHHPGDTLWNAMTGGGNPPGLGNRLLLKELGGSTARHRKKATS